MLGLYDVHLAPDGRRVDYPALVRDPNFADYITAATELQKVGREFGFGSRSEQSVIQIRNLHRNLTLPEA